MKVILIEDVKGTGKKDQIKEVKDGFGSFLIKNKKAVPYSQKSKEVLNTQLEDRKQKLKLLNNKNRILEMIRNQDDKQRIKDYLEMLEDK